MSQSVMSEQGLELIAEVSRLALRSDDLTALINESLDLIMRVGPFDTGVIRLVDLRGRRLELITARGLRAPEPMLNWARSQVSAEAVATRYSTFAHWGARVLDDLTQVTTHQLYRPECVESLVLVPILSETAALGLVELGTRTHRAFAAVELRMLEAAADQLGVAIQKAQLNAETQRAQQTIQVERARIDNLVSTMPGIVWDARRSPESQRMQAHFVSPHAETVLGYPIKDWLSTPNFWSRVVHPEDPERVKAERDSAIARGADSLVQEVRLLTQDGRVVWTETRIEFLRDAQGQIIGTRGVSLDVSERKQAELALRRSEAQLQQAQKLEALGLLARGIAHDFNNLLTAIIGFSDLVQAGLDAEDPLSPFVQEISSAGQRAANLTRQLLTFSRQQVVAPRILDLRVVLTEMDKLLRRVIGADVELITVFEPQGALITADPGQIEQIILNLAVNARDAMPTGGRLTIEIATVEVADSAATAHLELPAGPFVLLAVTDSGHGMDAETQARIFEPFFTTKGPGRGTGLGLATVYGIVAQSGGKIAVYSEPGYGTTFHLYFPQAQAAAGTSSDLETHAELPRGSETILVVDDEAAVRTLARTVLESLGYTVLVAGYGDEALAVISAHPGPLDLVITDLVLPGMGGRKVAAAVADR